VLAKLPCGTGWIDGKRGWRYLWLHSCQRYADT